VATRKQLPIHDLARWRSSKVWAGEEVRRRILLSKGGPGWLLGLSPNTRSFSQKSLTVSRRCRVQLASRIHPSGGNFQRLRGI